MTHNALLDGLGTTVKRFDDLRQSLFRLGVIKLGQNIEGVTVAPPYGLVPGYDEPFKFVESYDDDWPDED